MIENIHLNKNKKAPAHALPRVSEKFATENVSDEIRHICQLGKLMEMISLKTRGMPKRKK